MFIGFNKDTLVLSNSRLINGVSAVQYELEDYLVKWGLVIPLNATSWNYLRFLRRQHKNIDDHALLNKFTSTPDSNGYEVRFFYLDWNWNAYVYVSSTEITHPILQALPKGQRWVSLFGGDTVDKVSAFNLHFNQPMSISDLMKASESTNKPLREPLILTKDHWLAHRPENADALDLPLF